MVANDKRPEDAARQAVIALLGHVDLKTSKEDEDKTEYLIFLPERKLSQLATIVVENWDALAAATEAAAAQADTGENQDEGKAKAKGKAKGKSKAKNDGPEISKEVKAAVESLLKDSRETPEIALFGRMIANSPDWNVEAACQVAQALSTHRVSMEFDFFTAVDDLKKDSESGSDMMGTVQFNSACFYRYAVVDCDALQANLGGADQVELCKTSIEAFLKAFVHARPTGKQNSMAAHTLPSLVLITVRDGGEALSLANAFAKPVLVQKTGDDLQQLSAEALKEHWLKLSEMYPEGTRVAYLCALHEQEWDASTVKTTKSVADAIEQACSQIGVGTEAA